MKLIHNECLAEIDKIITADIDYYELPNEIINNDYVGYPLFDELEKKWEFKEKWEDKEWEFEEKWEDKDD